MPQIETMSLDDKLAISNRAFELLDAGDREGYNRVMKTTPLPPYLTKVIKEKAGLDCLLKLRRNLSEVEAEFGSDWLHK